MTVLVAVSHLYHNYYYYLLLYDPYGPARAFIAKLLRKSPYEGRTWWREQVRKKPSGPARIAYSPHTGILSIARARSKLKQLCCCINPDFSVRMSNIPNFVTRKKKNRKKREKGKAWWSYNKMLIDWVRSGRTGKYLALGHGARTLLRSVRTPWPRAKYFPVWPSHSVNKYIVLLLCTGLWIKVKATTRFFKSSQNIIWSRNYYYIWSQ